MPKIISVLLSALLIISIPIYCLADEETPDEIITEITENESFEELETEDVSQEDFEDEEVADNSEIHFDYWVVPMSSQIKVGWAEENNINMVEVYISSDNENFEYLGETSDNYYIIDNLSHRKKYYIRLVTEKDNSKIICEAQSVRVK
ncbi:MAG: hypothetical protein IJR70_09435 [Eubacterium sp.]|nr:hypothetical protein [Eubacterium sp.]